MNCKCSYDEARDTVTDLCGAHATAIRRVREKDKESFYLQHKMLVHLNESLMKQLAATAALSTRPIVMQISDVNPEQLRDMLRSPWNRNLRRWLKKAVDRLTKL